MGKPRILLIKSPEHFDFDFCAFSPASFIVELPGESEDSRRLLELAVRAGPDAATFVPFLPMPGAPLAVDAADFVPSPANCRRAEALTSAFHGHPAVRRLLEEAVASGGIRGLVAKATLNRRPMSEKSQRKESEMAEQMRSADRMVKMFREDAALQERLKTETDPIFVLQETATRAKAEGEPAYMGDKMLYRIAVIVLGLLALFAAAGSIGLVAAGKTTPEVLVALGSAAVGALVGLFAPVPTGK